jgi:CcmD family protein
MSLLRIDRGLRAGASVLVLLVACTAFAFTAHAQDPQGFVNASEIAKESLPAGPLVYTAYALVWLVLIGYVFLLWRRLDRVERDLRDVTARLPGKRS